MANPFKEKRPAIPPKRELRGDVKFPRPGDIQEKHYGGHEHVFNAKGFCISCGTEQ